MISETNPFPEPSFQLSNFIFAEGFSAACYYFPNDTMKIPATTIAAPATFRRVTISICRAIKGVKMSTNTA
jgi:hypothetical protein